MRLTTLPKDPSFWDAFAPWYELWATRSQYHRPIIAELSRMVEQGWQILDIGAATGIIAITMASLGCTVDALEPSEGMREILEKKKQEFNLESINVIPSRWEDYIPERQYNLILASNTLHLCNGGFYRGAEKMFAYGADYICIVTEINTFPVDFKVVDTYARGYDFLYIRSYETDCSFTQDIEGLKKLLREYEVEASYQEKVNLTVLWWERS